MYYYLAILLSRFVYTLIIIIKPPEMNTLSGLFHNPRGNNCNNQVVPKVNFYNKDLLEYRLEKLR